MVMGKNDQNVLRSNTVMKYGRIIKPQGLGRVTLQCKYFTCTYPCIRFDIYSMN